MPHRLRCPHDDKRSSLATPSSRPLVACWQKFRYKSSCSPGQILTRCSGLFPRGLHRDDTRMAMPNKPGLGNTLSIASQLRVPSGSSSKIFPSDCEKPAGAKDAIIPIPGRQSRDPVSQRFPATQSDVRNRSGTAKSKPAKSFSAWLLDAIYFLCPDCSCCQCSTIAAGLLMAALLTLLFLHLGGYWSLSSKS